VDKGVYGLYELAHGNEGDEGIKNRFLQSLERVFTSEDFDKKEIYEQVEFFQKLLKEEKLVIRKTREPNHAKLYLFKLEGDQHTFITGSANLTLAGLKGQEEFNVEIKDYGFESAEKYFDERWERAVPLSKEDIIKVFEYRTFFRDITPFVAYAYILKNYLELHQEKIPMSELEELMKKEDTSPTTISFPRWRRRLPHARITEGLYLRMLWDLEKPSLHALPPRLWEREELLYALRTLWETSTKNPGGKSI